MRQSGVPRQWRNRLRENRKPLQLTPLLILIGGAVTLGAITLQTQRNGDLPPIVSKLLDFGPPHLNYSSFRPRPVTPLEAYGNWDWSATTRVWESGTWDKPPGWRGPVTMERGNTDDVRVVYRRGQQWERAVLPPSKRLYRMVMNNLTNDDVTLNVNLETVPSNAEEIRLRGRFSRWHMYSGPTPHHWKAPPGLEDQGINKFLHLESAPFDVAIKAPGEPTPAALVTRDAAFEAVKSQWIVNETLQSEDALHDVIALQLRRKDGGDFRDFSRFWAQNIQLFDANGRRLELLGFDGELAHLRFGFDVQEWFGPDRPPRDLFAVLVTGWPQPKGGWKNVKAPLRLKAEISDGISWPQKLDIGIPRVKTTLRQFGGSPPQPWESSAT